MSAWFQASIEDQGSRLHSSITTSSALSFDQNSSRLIKLHIGISELLEPLASTNVAYRYRFKTPWPRVQPSPDITKASLFPTSPPPPQDRQSDRLQNIDVPFPAKIISLLLLHIIRVGIRTVRSRRRHAAARGILRHRRSKAAPGSDAGAVFPKDDGNRHQGQRDEAEKGAGPLDAKAIEHVGGEKREDGAADGAEEGICGDGGGGTGLEGFHVSSRRYFKAQEVELGHLQHEVGIHQVVEAL